MKLATVGTSFITEHFILAAQKEGSFEVDTVYSRTPDKAQALADKFKVPHTQSNWEALLADPTLDVIYIATPNDTHYDLACAVLNAKKHVILEKPFVSNAREFKSLMEIAKANHRYVFDAIIPIHLPNLTLLKESLNQLGELRMINMSMVQRSSRYAALQANQEPAIFSLKNSGGALMDLGVYPISILIALFGKPQKVSYVCHKYTNGIDVNGVLTLTYPTFMAAAVVAKDSAGLNFMTFSGDKGYLHVDKAPSMINTLVFVEKDKTTDLSQIQDAQTMVYEIKDFYDVILHHDDAKYDAWMSVTAQVIDVIDDCRKMADLVFLADGEK